MWHSSSKNRCFIWIYPRENPTSWFIIIQKPSDIQIYQWYSHDLTKKWLVDPVKSHGFLLMKTIKVGDISRLLVYSIPLYIPWKVPSIFHLHCSPVIFDVYQLIIFPLQVQCISHIFADIIFFGFRLFGLIFRIFPLFGLKKSDQIPWNCTTFRSLLKNELAKKWSSPIDGRVWYTFLLSSIAKYYLSSNMQNNDHLFIAIQLFIHLLLVEWVESYIFISFIMLSSSDEI